MNTDEALLAYKQALDLRPNYVRTLVNIGLAYNNKVEYLEAAQHFLYALCLNPRAEHIWSYFRQSCLQADRFDLLDRIDAKDVNLFAKDLKLLSTN